MACYHRQLRRNDRFMKLLYLVLLLPLLLGCSNKPAEIDLYRYLAERGNIYAQVKMGYFYLHGKGVQSNRNQAIQYFKEAAQVEYSDAQKALGLLYYDSKDYQQSVYWFQLAAWQGDNEAQLKLANLLLSGKGIPKDVEEGIKWLQKSAAQANVSAQFQLGELYQAGILTTRDLIQSLIWYKIAYATCQEMLVKVEKTMKHHGYYFPYNQHYPGLVNKICQSSNELYEYIEYITTKMQPNDLIRVENQVDAWLVDYKPQKLK